MASCERSTYSLVLDINPKIRKRQSFKLKFKGCIAGKLHHGFLEFYRKLTCLLNDCNCTWISDPFIAGKQLGLKSDS
jgi:hypothetical protein